MNTIIQLIKKNSLVTVLNHLRPVTLTTIYFQQFTWISIKPFLGIVWDTKEQLYFSAFFALCLNGIIVFINL